MNHTTFAPPFVPIEPAAGFHTHQIHAQNPSTTHMTNPFMGTAAYTPYPPEQYSGAHAHHHFLHACTQSQNSFTQRHSHSHSHSQTHSHSHSHAHPHSHVNTQKKPSQSRSQPAGPVPTTIQNAGRHQGYVSELDSKNGNKLSKQARLDVIHYADYLINSLFLCDPAPLLPTHPQYSHHQQHASLPPLTKLKKRHPVCKGSHDSGHRLILASLIVASKYLYDDTYDNKAWAAVSNGLYRLEEVNNMEAELLRFLDYSIHVRGQEWMEIVGDIDDHLLESRGHAASSERRLLSQELGEWVVDDLRVVKPETLSQYCNAKTTEAGLSRRDSAVSGLVTSANFKSAPPQPQHHQHHHRHHDQQHHHHQHHQQHHQHHHHSQYHHHVSTNQFHGASYFPSMVGAALQHDGERFVSLNKTAVLTQQY